MRFECETLQDKGKLQNWEFWGKLGTQKNPKLEEEKETLSITKLVATVDSMMSFNVDF